MAGGIAELLGRKNLTKGVKVEILEQADLSGLTREGLMSGVWETLRPGNLPVSSRDYETRGAQTRALAEISGQS